MQCEAGLVMATGTPDSPARPGISIADIAAGMYAYTGILTALYDRERTGEGATLHVAMIDALAEWMTQPVYFSAYGGQPLPRTGARHPSISPYGPFTVLATARCSSGSRTSGSGWCSAARYWISLSWPPIHGSPATRTGRPATTS